MDVLRRNTDYALRSMLNLAKHYEDEVLSTKAIADEEQISYQFACKILQKLHDAKLVESRMGPRGGFRLSLDPSKITVLQIIEAVQGPVSLSKCLVGAHVCPLQTSCPVRVKLEELQESMNSYLGSITLKELVRSHGAKTQESAKRTSTSSVESLKKKNMSPDRR